MDTYIVKAISYENGDKITTEQDMSSLSATPIALVTTEARDYIVEPTKGLIIYNTDFDNLQYFNGAEWKTVAIV